MDASASGTAELTGPGGRFEIVQELVLGEPTPVFRSRLRSLPELLGAGTRRYADREFLVFGEARYTFADHERMVRSVAAELSGTYGVRKGDRVAVIAANSAEWITVYWATVSLGAILVAMNAWWAPDEVAYGVADCEPTLLLADERRRRESLGALGDHVRVVALEDVASWWQRPADPPADPGIAEDDPAVVMYTSGTTGRPKGATHSHRNVLAHLQTQEYASEMAALAGRPRIENPCSLVPAPLFHLSGLYSGASAPLVFGTKTIWTQGRFSPERVLEITQRERVTRWSMMVTHLWRMLDHPDLSRHDLTSLRQVNGGGSVWPPELIRALERALPQVTVSVGYGLTESSGSGTTVTGTEIVTLAGSVGTAQAGMEVEVRGPDDRPLPDGEEGEICLRGAPIMLGYWRNPEATATSIRAGRWLHTGDIGRIVDGRLYLGSRRSDLIIRGGENIYPAEIENRLVEHPGVAECVVVGVDNRELGQEVKAVVVPRPGVRLDVKEIKDWVGSALAYYKVPAYVELRAEPLPRNSTMKVMRHALEDPGAVGAPGDVPDVVGGGA